MVKVYKEIDLQRRDGKVKVVQVYTAENYREALEKVEQLKKENQNPNIRFYTGDIWR